MTETPENIPQANQLLYCLKLTSGEELLCTVISEERSYLVIESPIQVKLLPMLGEDGEIRNQLTTSMWMPFAKDRIFYLSYSSISVLSAMHETAQKMYTRMVNKLESQPVRDIEDEVTPSPMSFFVDSNEVIQ